MSPVGLAVACALGYAAGSAHRRWPESGPGIVLIALGLGLALAVAGPWWLA